MVRQVVFRLNPKKRGFHLITQEVLEHLAPLPETGLVQLFIQHTSAGLTINENADPDVRIDFESIMNRIVPEDLPFLRHTLEGSDDMPAHVKASLIGFDVSIPITNGRLSLGTWQGIYLGEFRNHGGTRKIVATIISG
jgi:secondary thiamine-phosphate synthase enzyme